MPSPTVQRGYPPGIGAGEHAAAPGQARVWAGVGPAKIVDAGKPLSFMALSPPRVSGALLGLAAIAAWILLAWQVLLWSRLSVLRSGYELSAARQMVSRLEEEKQRLGIEAELLSDPANLGREASRRLGMRPPRPGEIVGAQ